MAAGTYVILPGGKKITAEEFEKIKQEQAKKKSAPKPKPVNEGDK